MTSFPGAKSTMTFVPTFWGEPIGGTEKNRNEDGMAHLEYKRT
jgi:hypothetical protein